jgi:dihydropteroate synthase
LSGYQKGARIFRVHNVFETKQALDVFKVVS